MSSNFTVKKVCEQCGQIFLAKTTVTRFCSKPCNSKNYKQQIRNEKIGKSNEVVHTGISHQLQELTSLEFLSVKATAKLLGASDKIVYNMIRSGRLKATNLSARKTVISRKDIDSLFELPAATNEDPADLANCYHMGETQAIYNISEKALYDIIKRNNITKIQSGKFTYVAKSALDKIFNNMASVTIRKKGISKNRHCIYLDYYPPVRNPKTGKLHRFEFLKVYLFDKPGSALERKHNQETMELVENVRAHRQLDIQNEKFGFISSDMRKGNFVEFFKAYINSKTRSECDNLAMSHRYFVEFAGDVLYFNELTDFLCEDYKHYLLSGPGIGHRQKPITKNTAVNYYAKFRSALKQAYKRELIAVDLYSQVEPINPKETHRERLEIEEFQLLANTPVKSDLVKRAALFAGLTGLRFSDVTSLLWSEVRGSAGKHTLQFTQKKTEGAVMLPVSDQAVELLGERQLPDEKVFKGLSYSNMRDVFKLWLHDAGITKNITFHSFRHTFATLQLEMGTDLYTVSKMLGHKSIKTTQIYAKVVDKKKVEAAGRIKLNLEMVKLNS